MADPVQTATGETGTHVLWMIGGALGVGALVLFLAPYIGKFLNISLELGLVLVGAALAYLASGALRKAGQGAALTGLVLLSFQYLMPMVTRLFGGASQIGGTAGGLTAGLA